MSRLQLHERQVGISIDNGHEVVEVVRDSSGQPADGLHSLSLAKLFFEVRSGSFRFFSRSDVHCDATHTHRISFVVTDNCGARLDPHNPPILRNPTELADSALAGGEELGRFARRALTVLRMNNGEPEVRRGQPLLDTVAQHALDMVADKVRLLVGIVGTSPSLPYESRHARNDLVQTLALTEDFNQQTGIFLLRSLPLRQLGLQAPIDLCKLRASDGIVDRM